MTTSLKCVIIDDNEIDRLMLLHHLGFFSRAVVTGVFADVDSALQSDALTAADVLFLDIDMPGMNGLDARRMLTDVPVCIFVTAHPEFAAESFELETLDYLVKPVSGERFAVTMSRIHEYMDIRSKVSLLEDDSHDDSIRVKDGFKVLSIPVGDIIYLNAFQNYTAIITECEKQFVRSTLGNLLKEKGFGLFQRIHKSYAVQKKYVRSISSHEIMLRNGDLLPVGRAYKEDVRMLI